MSSTHSPQVINEPSYAVKQYQILSPCSNTHVSKRRMCIHVSTRIVMKYKKGSRGYGIGLITDKIGSLKES